MGFIFGIINFNGNPVNVQELSTLCQSVGWEGFKEKQEIEGSNAFGYCWNAKREPKAGIYTHEQFTVIADIRLYNAEDLKRELDFNTPVEAFAKAYLRWGMSCVHHLNGDFAAAVIDKKEQKVHLFRDHIGARPLVYHFNQGQLIFASHEFGIAKSGLLTIKLSEETLIHRLFNIGGDYAETAFRNIRKVVPGYCSSFSLHHTTHAQYWQPEKIRKDRKLSYDQAVARLRKMILKATLSRMEKGITGVHVSGGIDSTGVASILADHIEDKSKLIGYSWSPEEIEDDLFDGVNEKEYIEDFSKEKGVIVKYLRLEKNEYIKDQILFDFEHQMIEHPTMQMAQKDEVQILFSGWGGDEFVSLSLRGTFNHLFFSFKWLTLLKWVQRFGLKSSVFRFRTEVLPLLIPFGMLHTYQPFRWSILRYLKFKFIVKHWTQIFFHRRKNIFGFGNRTRFMLNLLTNYHIPERMDSWALYAERYGFEYRYPLLDKELLEYWFSIPVKYTYRDFQKRLLYREALKGILTEKIRLRTDKGEGARIAYSLKNSREGISYLSDLLDSIPQNEETNIFNHRLLCELGTQSHDSIKGQIHQASDLTFYIKYLRLKREYEDPVHSL